MFVTPFLTTILGFIMINEKPDKSTLLGGVIILSGLFIFNKQNLLEPFKNKNKSKTDDIACINNTEIDD